MSTSDDQDRDLRAAFSRLPRSIEPERDLWSGIQAAIQPQTQAGGAETAGAFPRKRRASIPMGWAIAASVASIGIGMLITWGLQQRAAPVTAALAPAPGLPANGTTAAGRPAPGRPTPDYSFVPASTDAVRIKLEQQCAAQLANLSPKTRAKVEKNLEIIRASIHDIQSALASDPSNTLLQDLLVTTYQNELNTLANVEAAASAAHSEVSI